MKRPPPHAFADKRLQTTALTHRSFGKPNNERLEWLGDALLQSHASAIVYRRFPRVAEGGLTFIRTRLVCGETLARLARQFSLPAQLRLGGAELPHGRDNDNILAGAMEAYVAAVHLDGGDIGAFLAALFAEDLDDIEKQIRRDGVRALRDAKTRLQEFVQARGETPPTYRLVKKHGRAHQQTFVVECRTHDGGATRAQGASLAAAQQEAARLYLKKLQNDDIARA